MSDGELHDLFVDSRGARRAVEVLLEYRKMPTATAYKTLQRAVRLGLVERRGRSLYPLRR